MNQRRQFLARLASYAAAAGVPALAFADDDRRSRSTGTSGSVSTAARLPVTGLSGRVIVVGGGMAGAAVAKFLRLWGGNGVKVTLVEREAQYTSNILSNLVLTDQVRVKQLGERPVLKDRETPAGDCLGAWIHGFNA